MKSHCIARFFICVIGKTIHLSFLMALLVLCSCNNKDVGIENSVSYPAGYVINGENNTISVVDLIENKIKKIFDLTTIKRENLTSTVNGFWSHHIDYSFKKNLLAVANPAFDFSQSHDALHSTNSNLKGGILLIDKNSGMILKRIVVPKINYSVKFSKDGNELWTATTNHSGYLYIYDSNSGDLLKSIQLGSDPTDIVFSDDGSLGFVALSQSGFVVAIDTEKKEIVKFIKVDLGPDNVRNGGNGQLLVENKVRKSVNIIDVEKLFTVDYLDLDFTPSFVTMNNSTKELWILNSDTKEVNIFKKELVGWRKTNSLRVGYDLHSLTFNKDFTKAYIVSQNFNKLLVIDVKGLKMTQEILVGSKPNGVVLIEQ